MTAAAPSGVVTFLFTDIEGSTRWWEADAAHEGFLFSHTGDSFVAAFASPMYAVNAAIDAQRELQLAGTNWQPARPSCATVTISARCSTTRRG